MKILYPSHLLYTVAGLGRDRSPKITQPPLQTTGEKNVINARRACARGLQYFVCLFVTNFLASFQVYMTKYTYLHDFR